METPAPVAKQRFWPRQFSKTITSRQKFFDLAVGAVIPILLLIFDPVVFRHTGLCVGPVLGGYATFGYLAIGLGSLTLAVWLLAAESRRTLAAPVAGVLLAGALFAGGVGVALVPVSIFGLLTVGIGILGFFPFLTAFVYLRNGVRALWMAAAIPVKTSRLVISLIVGAALVLGIPALAQVQVSNVIAQSVNTISENPVSPSPAAIDALKQLNTLCFRLCTGTIHTGFRYAAVGYKQRSQLAVIYEQITGESFDSSNCFNTSD